MASNTHSLPQFLDISTAEELKNLLSEALESGKKITLDGSEVVRMTTPAVQLLLAASKSAEEQNKKIHLKNPSNIIEQSFRELGLEEAFSALKA